MSIITAASGRSVWRGYEYCMENKVSHIRMNDDATCEGLVSGSADQPYSVMINTQHPRKSRCDCPHANGRIVCKHMVALFFAAFPEEAERFRAEVVAQAEEEERRQEQLDERIYTYVHRLKKDQLQQLTMNLIYSLPDWAFDRFVRDYIETEDGDGEDLPF